MNTDDSIYEEQTSGWVWPPLASGFLVVIVFLLFAVLEADFLADLYTLANHQVFSSCALAALGFQLDLITAFLGFWMLWRKRFIVRIRGAKQDFFAIYLSLAMVGLISSVIIHRKVDVAVYQVTHQLVPHTESADRSTF